MLAGLTVSAILWIRRTNDDPMLALVWLGGLVGALLGAHVGFILAELPARIDGSGGWLEILGGRTILGALLGGYLGVEGAKRMVGYRDTTGDVFAFIAPIGLVLGRIGCLLQGCCPGRPCAAAWYAILDAEGVTRWPAPVVESLFNLLAALLLAHLHRRRVLPGQLFHVYLMAYGVFRFGHEFARDTPRLGGGFSGYQVLALLVAGFGTVRFLQRWGSSPTHGSPGMNIRFSPARRPNVDLRKDETAG
ncbi:MAG: diacylglyceryl transferase [Phycisphaeraceae bacterium]|nr:diacylglyceryl transferase [Phycisphaeraceae bacterium]